MHGKSIFFIEVMNELELFIDKKVSVGLLSTAVRRAVRRMSANFVIGITFFLSRHFSLSV
jgi:hypothetical protein